MQVRFVLWCIWGAMTLSTVVACTGYILSRNYFRENVTLQKLRPLILMDVAFVFIFYLLLVKI